MLNKVIRMSITLVYIATSVLVLITLSKSGRGERFAGVAFFAFAAFRSYIGFETWLMKRNRELAAMAERKPSLLGYVLLLIASVAAGYGFADGRKDAVYTGAIIASIMYGLVNYMLRKAVARPSKKSGINTNWNAKMENLEPSAQVFFKVLDEKRKTDPLVGVKIGGKEIFKRTVEAMKDSRGVHAESLLCALGALAGYSCQANLRAQAAAGGLRETALMVTTVGGDGRNYYFGDHLNATLAEASYSVWSLAAGAAQKNGCEDLPDVNAIFEHVAGTVGSAAFGIPRLPPDHTPGATPFDYLKTLWPPLFPIVNQFCGRPDLWPILFACAIQEALDAAKETLPATLALQIVMESAIPMSKVDLSAA